MVASLGLDFEAAARLVSREQFGDWYRDPWGWPELNYEDVSSLDAHSVVHKVDGQFHLVHAPHFQLLEVPKTSLGVRPAVNLDPLSRVAYLAAVSSGMKTIHKDLPSWVYGWRVRAGDPTDNGEEWRAYAASIPKEEPEGNQFGLLTDITSFFASIDPSQIEQILIARWGRSAATNVIMDILNAHHGRHSRSGLPQRSFASAMLAHTVLSPIDDALETGRETDGLTVRRWMDDISAEGSEGALFSLLLTLQDAARQVGLELNASKTKLVPLREALAEMWINDLANIEVPSVILRNHYTDEETTQFDLSSLLKLENYIIEHPMGVPRTLATSVLLALRRYDQFERTHEWMGVARYLPHVADGLGRYFRAAAESAPDDAWGPLRDWYVEFISGPWGRLDWSCSQLALTFNSAETKGPLTERFKAWLENSDDVQQVAIAVERLGQVDPLFTRTTIRRRVDRTIDPLLLRVFALGLLSLDENRRAVESLLRRDPRNRLLLTHLERTRWRPPTAVDDFDTTRDTSAG